MPATNATQQCACFLLGCLVCSAEPLGPLTGSIFAGNRNNHAGSQVVTAVTAPLAANRKDRLKNYAHVFYHLAHSAKELALSHANAFCRLAPFAKHRLTTKLARLACRLASLLGSSPPHPTSLNNYTNGVAFCEGMPWANTFGETCGLRDVSLLLRCSADPTWSK